MPGLLLRDACILDDQRIGVAVPEIPVELQCSLDDYDVTDDSSIAGGHGQFTGAAAVHDMQPVPAHDPGIEFGDLPAHAQRLSLEVLHDQVVQTVLVADVVQRADIGMGQARDGLRFPFEALSQLRSEVRTAEARVAKLEEMREKLSEKLADPALYEPAKAGDLAIWQKKYAEVMDGLARAEALWETAQERLDAAQADPEHLGMLMAGRATKSHETGGATEAST